jgi:hypothetical protein
MDRGKAQFFVLPSAIAPNKIEQVANYLLESCLSTCAYQYANTHLFGGSFCFSGYCLLITHYPSALEVHLFSRPAETCIIDSVLR